MSVSLRALRAAGNYWGDIYRDEATQSSGSRASVRQLGLLVPIGGGMTGKKVFRPAVIDRASSWTCRDPEKSRSRKDRGP